MNILGVLVYTLINKQVVSGRVRWFDTSAQIGKKMGNIYNAEAALQSIFLQMQYYCCIL